MENIWLVIPVVIFAGIVRGFSGFGFAAIAVVGLNLFFPAQQSVMIVLSLDIICSINLWKSAFKQTDFSTLKNLTVGSLIGIPIGYGFLVIVPEEMLKMFICLIILLLSLLLFSEFKPFNADKKSTKIGFGLASGAGTASASVGGPMIVYYMLSSSLSTGSQRATMILFFLISELLALITLFAASPIDPILPQAILILTIPTLVSVYVGQLLFDRKPPQSLKSFALPVMIMVALLGLINSTIILFH